MYCRKPIVFSKSYQQLVQATGARRDSAWRCQGPEAGVPRRQRTGATRWPGVCCKGAGNGAPLRAQEVCGTAGNSHKGWDGAGVTFQCPLAITSNGPGSMCRYSCSPGRLLTCTFVWAYLKRVCFHGAGGECALIGCNQGQPRSLQCCSQRTVQGRNYCTWLIITAPCCLFETCLQTLAWLCSIMCFHQSKLSGHRDFNLLDKLADLNGGKSWSSAANWRQVDVHLKEQLCSQPEELHS